MRLTSGRPHVSMRSTRSKRSRRAVFAARTRRSKCRSALRRRRLGGRAHPLALTAHHLAHPADRLPISDITKLARGFCTSSGFVECIDTKRDPVLSRTVAAMNFVRRLAVDHTNVPHRCVVARWRDRRSVGHRRTSFQRACSVPRGASCRLSLSRVFVQTSRSSFERRTQWNSSCENG